MAVQIPVVGKVDERWLYAGGAAVAGIVTYAWWSGRGEPEPVLVPEPVTDFEPPTVVDSGISVGQTTPTPGIAETNVEWVGMAAEQAAALGFSDAVIASGLTKYLAKGRLSESEAQMVSAVVAILGQPPNNGPFPIQKQLPGEPEPEPDQLPAPTGFNPVGTSPTTIVLQWNRVAGAVRYEIREAGGPWHNAGAVERITIPVGPPIGRVRTFEVRAVGANGAPGAAASGTGATITRDQYVRNLLRLRG